MKIFIKGYYGQDNLGDDLILSAFACWAKKNGHRLVIARGADTSRIEEVMRLVGFTDYETTVDTLRANLAALGQAQGVIFGGGGLFTTDAPKVMRRFLIISALAALFGKRTAVIGVSVTPIQRRLTSLSWRMLGLLSSVVTVRNSISFDTLSAALGRWVGSRKLFRTEDVVFSLNFPELLSFRPDQVETIPRQCAFAIANLWPGQSIEENEAAYSKALEATAEVLSGLTRNGWNFVLVPFSLPQDLDMAILLQKRLDADNVRLSHELSIRERFFDIARSELIITMRFHGLVIGSSIGRKVLTLAYDYKATSLAAELGLADFTIRFGSSKTEYFKESIALDSKSVVERSLALGERTDLGYDLDILRNKRKMASYNFELLSAVFPADTKLR